MVPSVASHLRYSGQMAFQNRVDALRELMRRGWRPLIDEEGGVSGLLSSMVDAYDIEQLEAFVRLDGVRSLSIAAALVDRYNDFEQGQLKIEVREMKSLVGVLYRPAGMSMTEAREMRTTVGYQCPHAN